MTLKGQADTEIPLCDRCGSTRHTTAWHDRMGGDTESWHYTDNPDDPCVYCVGWTSRGNPIDVRGRREPHVWRGIHDVCAQSVADYIAESAGQP